MNMQKRIKKLKKSIPVLSNNMMIIIVIAIIVGGTAYALDGLEIIQYNAYDIDNTMNTTTMPTTGTIITTTTTTTVPTTTTTIIVPDPEFRFKAEWIWEPAMGTTKPTWIIIEVVYNNAAELYCDGVYMFSSSIWYYPVGSFHFQIGDSYRVSVMDNVGYDFQLDYVDYQVVVPGYTGMSWELTNSGVGWGHLIFEWVEI